MSVGLSVYVCTTMQFCVRIHSIHRTFAYVRMYDGVSCNSVCSDIRTVLSVY